MVIRSVISLLSFLVISTVTPSFAQEQDEALNAYNAGDYATAERIWRNQAAEGNAMAQYNLGFLHESGIGVAKNMANAKFWYTEAAEQDNELAETAMASITYAEKNFTEALKWFAKAANRFNPDAQARIGSMYLSGEGVEADNAKAVAWIERAAGNGHANAQHWLGDWYWEQRDLKSALGWYDKAVSSGIAEAEPKRDEIYENLFAPALVGEDIQPVAVNKKPIKMGMFSMMGRQYEVSLTRVYAKPGTDSALAARILLNDTQSNVLMDYFLSDLATVEDDAEKEIVQAPQEKFRAFDFGEYRGMAEYSGDRLTAVVLKLTDNIVFEYELRGANLTTSRIEDYLPKTKFGKIAETLNGHGFEKSAFAREEGKDMFKELSDDVASQLQATESSNQ